MNLSFDELIRKNEELENRIRSLEREVTDFDVRNTQLLSLLDNIPFYIWLKDREGRYVIVNKEFSEYYQSLNETLIGKTDFDICTLENADKYDATDKEVFELKKRKSYQDVTEDNGALKWSETYKSPIFDENKNVIGIAGISRDITNRKSAEKALKFSEEKYKELVTMLPEMVFETDVEGNFTFFNLKAFETFGFTNEDFSLGINLDDILIHDDIERLHVHLSRLIQKENIRREEYTAITKSGRRFPVLIYTNLLMVGDSINGFRGVMVDITDQRNAEDRERKYNRNLVFLSNTALKFLSFSNDDDILIFIGKKLAELTKNSIVIVSSFNDVENALSVRFISGINRYLNNILQILGINPEELNIHLTEDYKTKLVNHSQSLFSINGGLYSATLGQINKANCIQLEKLLKLTNYYAMGLMRGGNLYAVVLIATKSNQDIKDVKIIETFLYQASISLHRKQLENELIRAKLKAEESDRLKSAFLANMSHEIRTPMNGILGMAQLLAIQDITSEQRKEYISLINSNSDTLLSLIDDIIDVSKIEAGQMKFTSKSFRLNELLDQVYALFMSSSVYKSKPGLQLVVIKTLPDNLSLFTDPDRLRQILINLIGNSLKFTDCGFVEFGYNLREEMLEFYVKDTGIGISDEKQKVIFDRFIQADDSLTRKFGGSGLGLAISKGLIEILGGHIWVQSRLHKGSTFRFTIPYITSFEEDEPDKQLEDLKTDFDWSDKAILIVEDDKVSYKFLHEIFKKTKAKIYHAVNGLQAIELCKTHLDIDIVLMDIQLPEMSGLDATKIIKNLRRDLPIIAQTANAMSEDKEKCIEVGCVDYISKPINVPNLFRKINKYLPKY